MSDYNKEIEDKLKIAGVAGLMVGVEELGRWLFQSRKRATSSLATPPPPRTPGGDNNSPYYSHRAEGNDNYPAATGETEAYASINAGEARSGTFRLFTFHWHEEIVDIPAGIKDGEILRFRGRGAPADPGNRDNYRRKDLNVKVLVQ